MKLKLVQNDPWLEPFNNIIEYNHLYTESKEKELTSNCDTLSQFATGYLYFGLHLVDNKWVIREWAPNATELYLIGELNNWSETPQFRFNSIGNGVWELSLAQDILNHGDHYKLKVKWHGGEGERIPAYARRVVQDKSTYLFSAQVWEPKEKYTFKINKFKPKFKTPIIYECHIGMAQEEGKVGSFNEFRELILPRIEKAGYNTIQIMAIQEHPYYGSFGYHVSNFFASSSRFGTPEELKALIDEAHKRGIAVIMDIVHSHAVKNENEGLAKLDGSLNQYFHSDHRREHPAWDSLCFDYGKNEVLHFLLSNCKFWMDEFKFDGFRFDGVTSMLYWSHGLGESFSSYDSYYNGSLDIDAVCYLTLANKLIHQINPKAITIAEEMSGLPGLASPAADGGIGFDYRMAMGIPDFWIKLIKEFKDEDWHPSSIWWELTNRRTEEKTVSYAESHDQALVGDKTILFRLADADLYWGMSKNDASSLTIDRAIALHKMIRLVTATTINGAYLNFMGNEFGHPEWIDFPREGNNWSYHHSRRQWSICDDTSLKFHYLNDFDRQITTTVSELGNCYKAKMVKVCDNDGDQILAYTRGEYLFVHNFNPTKSFEEYGLLVPRGKWINIFNSDEEQFGGFARIDKNIEHLSIVDPLYRRYRKEWIKIYIPSRTSIVLKRVKD